MRGLLLDLDGVLCDSLPALRQAYRRFLQAFDAPATDAEFDALNGPPLAEVVRRLKLAHALLGEVDELLDTYRGLAAEAHAGAAAAAGAAEVLRAARRLGWRTAVVTSAPQASVRAWLERQRLAPLFDAVVDGEAVSRGKPDPEPYVTAAARLGAAAEHCLAVEDSEQGATAALQAGVATLFLGPAAPAAVEAHPRFAGRLAQFSDLGQWLDAEASRRGAP